MRSSLLTGLMGIVLALGACAPKPEAAPAPALKPGSVIKVDGKLVAIPKRKPRR